VPPGLELEEVEVAPAAAHTVVNQLMLAPARRARRTFAGVRDLEVDAPLTCVELDLGNVPRRLQAKRGGEEGFDLVVYGGKVGVLSGRRSYHRSSCLLGSQFPLKTA
jgi:hypothetical protein